MRYYRNPKVEPEKPQRKQLKQKPLLIVIGVLLLCNFFWLIAWLIPSSSKIAREEVAFVDGEAITRETWMAAMEKKIGRETLLELVNQKVIEAAAKKNKISVSEKEIDFELALMHAGDGQEFTGMNAEEERQKIRETLILEKVLTKDVVIDDKMIKSSFKENEALYNIETAYRVAMIVVETKADAEQVLNEASDGSNFEVLAKERSIDAASASLGGDIGYVNESMDHIDKGIYSVAKSMKIGTLSDVLPLSDGTFAIIRVSDKVKGRSFKLKEVKDHIKRELALEQLPESVKPEAFWKEFKAEWFYGE